MKKATIRYCCNALIMGVAVFACGIFAETSVKAEGTPAVSYTHLTLPTKA